MTNKVMKASLSSQVEELITKLNYLVASAPSMDGVLGYEHTYKKRLWNKYQQKYTSSSSKRYYAKLTLRTLVSVGYLLSLLKKWLFSETNYPSIVMIDTVGKYLVKPNPNIQS
ncbi:hypothetical protein [Paenibacillus planticolens]|uniref:Uncharacterized protein n=1 Tax=Paenibacillus planticolens TaxID=2654976 RepID=A0ABX1ZHC8_9BACL|nr:hypothetical protein [Paenibacillus planticolens]NOU99486.1 hypothetical protein [Paenibacillus planticolens]